ncbi:MAG: arylsulfatase [Opitutaceae bacterium]|nr:arylsulfatase [Opitutaceae bacterium]
MMHVRLSLLFVFALATAAVATVPTRPNIVFILADDLGYADLGCYGQTKIRTPNLDRLASEGTRFTQFYAGASVCAPSRCVLLTGKHTGHARIRANGPRVGGQTEYFGEGAMRLSLTDEDRTVAEALRASGYATAAIGKWGLGEPSTPGTPNRRGFDLWFGYLNQNHAAYYYTDYLWRDDRKEPIPENAGGRRSRYTHDLFADEAVAFLRRKHEKPFFLYLAFTIPHRRFEVPALGAYSGESWPDEAKIYAAMVTRLDRDVGRVLDTLGERGLAANTALFFTSDNGGERKAFDPVFRSHGPWRGTKGSHYEGGLRVPMLVRWPGTVPAGRISDAVGWFADMFPTMLAVAGDTAPDAALDGFNLLPTLIGGDQPALRARTLYWENPARELAQAARRGPWKAVRAHPQAPLELYRLDTDPGETRDLAAAHPDLVNEFRAHFTAAHTPSPHWPSSP